MSEFSSLKFSHVYLYVDIPGLRELYILQIAEVSINIYQAIQNDIDLINKNSGFYVTGWQNRGIINHKSLITARKATGYSNSAPVNNHNIFSRQKIKEKYNYS